MFQVGDTVEVVLVGGVLERHPYWQGLVGTIVAVLRYNLFRIRFPDPVPTEPHADPYILQLNPKRLRAVFREPDWEI